MCGHAHSSCRKSVLLAGFDYFSIFRVQRSQAKKNHAIVFNSERDQAPTQDKDKATFTQHDMSSYLAQKAAQQKASSFLEPLISDDESSDDETASQNGEYETVKQSPLQKLKSMGVYTALVAGVAMSVAASLLSPQTLVFVAAGICCAK